MKIVEQTASFSTEDFLEEYEVAFVEATLKGIRQKTLLVLENSKNDDVVLKFTFNREDPEAEETLSFIKGLFSRNKEQQNIFNFRIMCEPMSSVWAHRYSPKHVSRILSQSNDAIDFVVGDNHAIYLRTKDFRDYFPMVFQKLFFAGFFTSKDFFNFAFQTSFIHAPEVHKMMADIQGQMDVFFKNVNRDAVRQAELTPSP